MIKNKYRDLQLYRMTASTAWSADASYSLVKTFKGLIQVPSNSRQFINSKDGQAISGTLFCDVSEVFQSKDKIVDPLSNMAFLISGYTSQPLGVAGVAPKSGQHAEYSLIYAEAGI